MKRITPISWKAVGRHHRDYLSYESLNPTGMRVIETAHSTFLIQKWNDKSFGVYGNESAIRSKPSIITDKQYYNDFIITTEYLVE